MGCFSSTKKSKASKYLPDDRSGRIDLNQNEPSQTSNIYHKKENE